MYTLGLSVTDVAGRTHIRLVAADGPEGQVIALPDLEECLTLVDSRPASDLAAGNPEGAAVLVLEWALALLRAELHPDHDHSPACPLTWSARNGRLTVDVLPRYVVAGDGA